MVSTPRRLLFCAAALALLASGCASAHGFELSRVQRKDVQVLPGANGYVNPLTGIVSYTPQDWLHRRILGVKIGNSSPERPQSGIDRADVLYEELVEGGETRFLALFLTNQAPRVGPVRSVRTVDHKILQPLDALFAYSGGVPPIVNEMRATPGVTDVGADRAGDAYHRDLSRHAPYNLYTSTDQLWSGRLGSPPAKTQFDFLAPDNDATAGGDEKADDVKLSFSGDSSKIDYVYDAKTGVYGRNLGAVPHMVEGPGNGTQLTFRNVLVQIVNVSVGSTFDRAGTRTRDIDVNGTGDAVLFRGGRAFRGTWQRSSNSEPPKFLDKAGNPLRLAAGATIVELLPVGQNLFVS